MNKNKFTKTPYWQMSTDEVVQKLVSDATRGLTTQEATKRLAQYGYNQLPKKQETTAFTIFLSQFSSIIIVTLFAALIISVLLGSYIDALAIAFILILNAIVGFIQEYSAEKSLQELKKLLKPICSVVRDGTLQEIDFEQLVPGDIIELIAGDKIPADGRILVQAQLTTQEASLTGESTPVHKIETPLVDQATNIVNQNNMVFAGTLVVNGKARVIVTQTGAHTQLGTIATLLKKAPEEQTTFQKELARLEKNLVFLCLLIAVVVFIMGLIRGFSLASIIMTALSLAVASIPEGLPVVTTIVLAFGMRRMAKKKVLIRKLHAVETLGSTSVICTDKTGTLTENKMVATQLWTNEQYFTVTGHGYEQKGEFLENGKKIDIAHHPALSFALQTSALASSALLNKSRKTQQDPITGDPTEGALLILAAKAGIFKDQLQNTYTLVQEHPFDSTRKRSSSLRQDANNNLFIFAQGAPEIIIQLSSSILINNKQVDLTQDYKNRLNSIAENFAHQGLRVLALAYRPFTSNDNKDNLEDREQNLIFIGLVGIIDPARKEVKQAIEKCKKAGIKVVMITGDHKETALAIAQSLDIYHETDSVLTGEELEKISESEFKNIVQKVTVYARTNPAQKIKIVNAWKALGRVVAMTGDGVNDAPALKIADIGVAMGITGTQVSKEASDMILLDDNFSSIVNAIEEGRTIYVNIVKFVNYILSSNISEIGIIVIGMLLAAKDPSGIAFISLLPIQILWINFVTDGPPAIALSLDPVSKKIMEQPPRDPKQPIITYTLVVELIAIATTVTGATLFTAHYFLAQGATLAHTMAFTQLVVLEFVRLYMIRQEYKTPLFSNKWLILALVASFTLQLAAIYTPWLQPIFKTTALTAQHWLFIGAVAALVLLVNHVLFLILKKFMNK